MNIKDQIRTQIIRLFYAVFALSFAWLTIHIVVDGYYAYHEVPLLLVILCSLGLLVGMWQILRRYEAILGKYTKVITIGFLALMFVLQMAFGHLLRYKPIFDIDAVYGGAVEWAETGTFSSYYDYYSYFFNNFGALRFYYRVFRLARALGIKDYFMTATAINCILSLGTMYVTGKVGRKLLGVRGQWEEQNLSD